MNICVFGSGLVGRHIAADLTEDENNITLVDINKDNLIRVKKKYEKINIIESDVTKKENIKKIVKGMDIVVNAVPGSIGFKSLKDIIDTGTDVVDIAFYPQNPFELDNLANEKGVKAIVDMGIAPGISNLLSGYLTTITDKLTDVNIYVGGLPKIRRLPFEYKAVFSPADVIEEYTRPSRLVENERIVVKDPLTDPEFLEFDKIGTLEAFNSDGLRTLIETVKSINMKEKTLRYPGHREKMKLFSDTGMFSREKINVNGISVSPMDITTKLLKDHWKFTEDDRDFTVMRVIIKGVKEEEMIKYTFDLYDEYDEGNGVHSMARTTGYTAAMGVRLIREKKFQRIGISPPEFIGMERGLKAYVLEGLKRRNIHFSESKISIKNE
jgi:saccharopine dehydrogenase-like NADP-dependent oxidoreductase